MKKSMNFYAPMWLLVLGLAFGFFSYKNNEEDGNSRPLEGKMGGTVLLLLT
ncbi:hypothetical protein Fleli_0794 [Bernardetia litoralis DSM 6794]|uniref:Uncharacterized protein n=1 Tax=Bernardetia litoralis (strain ATCC 23117 / DSM 6794 / NBRC 15988 / NCIMB 1366 / Fx l1 / Sio-4) TaxID=880071 RepID=I4AH18_BERLS|nr:hypothetical protein [Bernardetia litoralis]AFM03253.1 hypothetical protein Fleli_0794 [Bernardetia litoralis DSM 6794]